MNRNAIIDFLKAHRDELRQEYGVLSIALFGSRARLDARDDSDIDLAIELEDGKKTLGNFFGLKDYLEAQLGSPVDLGIESAMKPIIRESARKDMLYV